MSSKSYKTYAELLQDGEQQYRGSHRAHEDFKRAVTEGMKNTMITGYVKLKKSAKPQDKFGNAALQIMKGNDAGDKMELLKLLLKHGYGLSLGTNGNTIFKLPKDASVPESSIGDYIKATSQGGHVDPNAGISSRPPAAGEDTDDGSTSGDSSSVATATTDTRDKALNNAQTTIEQLKNDMLGMVQERRQLVKHMEDMKASFEQELERASKQLHASEEEKQNILAEGRKMRQQFEEAEDRLIQLEQHMATQRNDADSDGFASATSSLDIEDPPENDDGPAETKHSIWNLFGVTRAPETPPSSAQPDPAGVPTVDSEKKPQKKPTQLAAVISPPQPTPDENERRLKDEQASKKQAQLGYNPSVNWYGQTTQWGKIIHELDSFSWGYGPEFKTSIDPWSLKQLEAIDPFL